MPDLNEKHIVTCFLRHRGEVLLLKRSGVVEAYAGRWDAPSGYAEGNPDAVTRKEIDEETGLNDAVECVRAGQPFPVEDEDLGTRSIVHPYLFDCTSREVNLNYESTEAEWVHPTELMHRETVPELWMSYVQVAPTVETIRGDRAHGAAYLSLRALEVVRDWSGRMAWQTGRGRLDPDKTWASIEALARQLLEARPAMAVLQNRINRAMHAASEEHSAAAAERAARAGIEQALRADDEAARRAAEIAAGKRVLTLSRSGTVAAALAQANPAPAVFVCASQPGGEGIGTAERLAEAGLDVTLLPDAAMAHALAEGSIDCVLTGADAVLPSGAVVNKTGTHLAALAAREAGAPFYAACAADKISTQETAALESGPLDQVYEGEAPLCALNPTFEVTPADLVTSIITERGMCTPEDIGAIATEMSALAGWQNSAA